MNSFRHPARRLLLLAMLAAGASAAWAQEFVDGEVRKVDKEQAKLTLKHGEIKSLDMPAMTMVFAVKDRSWLDTLKPGDKVRFKATQQGGRFTVVELQPQK